MAVIGDSILQEGHFMTLRVALIEMDKRLAEEGLGDDLLGRSITKGYRKRIEELLALIDQEYSG